MKYSNLSNNSEFKRVEFFKSRMEKEGNRLWVSLFFGCIGFACLIVGLIKLIVPIMISNLGPKPALIGIMTVFFGSFWAMKASVPWFGSRWSRSLREYTHSIIRFMRYG